MGQFAVRIQDLRRERLDWSSARNGDLSLEKSTKDGFQGLQVLVRLAAGEDN